MLVSVVVTTLNEEDHIGACLSSLVNQTVKPSELTLIDAGSTDRTLEIARRYPVDKFHTVTFRDVYRSKRLGILLSENDVVLCLDGDTWIAEDFTEKGLKLLNKGYDVATGYIYPSNPNPLSNFIAWLQNKNPKYLSGPAYLINKQAYLSTCKIAKINGFVDACTISKEVPLGKFEKAIKCPELEIYTELPSTGQARIITLLIATGVTTFLIWKYKH